MGIVAVPVSRDNEREREKLVPERIVRRETLGAGETK